jgi:hypothetical protein
MTKIPNLFQKSFSRIHEHRKKFHLCFLRKAKAKESSDGDFFPFYIPFPLNFNVSFSLTHSFILQLPSFIFFHFLTTQKKISPKKNYPSLSFLLLSIVLLRGFEKNNATLPRNFSFPSDGSEIE